MKEQYTFSKTPFLAVPPLLRWEPLFYDDGSISLAITSNGTPISTNFGAFPTPNLLLQHLQGMGFQPDHMPLDWQAYEPMTNLTVQEVTKLTRASAQKIIHLCKTGIISPCHQDERGKWIVDSESSLLLFFEQRTNSSSSKKKRLLPCCHYCGSKNTVRCADKKKMRVCRSCRKVFPIQ